MDVGRKCPQHSHLMGKDPKSSKGSKPVGKKGGLMKRLLRHLRMGLSDKVVSECVCPQPLQGMEKSAKGGSAHTVKETTKVKTGLVKGQPAKPAPGGVSELPENCIAMIFLYLPPRDIARSACVNRTWAAAARSDAAWNSKLPPQHRGLLREIKALLAAETLPRGKHRPSSRQSFESICEGMLVEKGQQNLSLDPLTGAVCLNVSVAESMGVFFPRDTESWGADAQARGSPFSRIAELAPTAYYVLVGGQVRSRLPAGMYAVSWRLSRCLHDPSVPSFYSYIAPNRPARKGEDPNPQMTLSEMFSGWMDGALESRIQGACTGGRQLALRVPVTDKDIPKVPKWAELPVGIITLKAQPGQLLCPLDLVAELVETEGNAWIGRLFVDSLVIRQIL